MTIRLDESNFEWRKPDPTRSDIMAEYRVPAFTRIILERGFEASLLLPAHEQTNFVDDGSGTGTYQAIVPIKYFKFSPYWGVDDVAYIIHDDGLGNYTKLKYNANAAAYADLAVGEWFYDETNRQVVAKYNAAGTCHAYYIPVRGEVKIIQKIRSPTGVTERTLLKGNISEFVLNDLSEFPVIITRDAVLEKNHSIIIKVLPRANAYQFDPFMPDGQTLVPILSVELEVDREKTYL